MAHVFFFEMSLEVWILANVFEGAFENSRNLQVWLLVSADGFSRYQLVGELTEDAGSACFCGPIALEASDHLLSWREEGLPKNFPPKQGNK